MTQISSQTLSFQQHFKFKSNLFLSTCLTVLLIAIYILVSKISLPFQNFAAIKEYLNTSVSFGNNSIYRFSILSLGIAPYLSSYLLVEIFSLMMPSLKKYRKCGVNGRRKLKAIATMLTFLIGMILGAVTINGFEQMTLPNGGHLLNIGSTYDFILLVTILVGGVYFIFILSELISKYGIGNGISLIFLTQILTRQQNT